MTRTCRTWQHPNPRDRWQPEAFTLAERRAYAKGATKAEAKTAERIADLERQLDIAMANFRNQATGLALVRMALEHVAPAGCVPSGEAVLLLYGPEGVHEGEALAKAIVDMVERLTA